MAPSIKFKCSNCGTTFVKWAGKCSSCDQWGTLQDYTPIAGIDDVKKNNGTTASSGAGKGYRASKAATGNVAKPVSEIAAASDTTIRIPSGINEFDRVLGGGLVPGGVILMAGEPGVGKSTAALLVAAKIANSGKKVLYISGEETANQVASRAIRIGATEAGGGSKLGETLYLLSEGNLQNAIASVGEIRPDFVVVDSVQTLLSDDSEGRVGSVTQVNEVATDFTNIAKRLSIPIILIGHVTKDGSIAGPRVVEHLVDVVLFFESNQDTPLRMLRAIKNRYGSTDEIGCFEHTAEGLSPVDDPSGFFVDEHSPDTNGFATSITLEGRRALPIEVQALVTPTRLPNPRKITQGIEHGRALQIQAVIDKYLALRLFDQDVYVATTGGLRIQDASTDLAVAAAIISSRIDKALPESSAFLGEVSLTGEIRSPRDREKRISEASRLFSTIYTTPGKKVAGANVIEVATLKDLYAKIGKPVYKKTKNDDDDDE